MTWALPVERVTRSNSYSELGNHNGIYRSRSLSSGNSCRKDVCGAFVPVVDRGSSSSRARIGHGCPLIRSSVS